MKFSGPDLVPGKFEVNALIVSRNVFSQEVLETAACRLLAAWPMLSFRMNIMRNASDDIPATSIHDGFFDVQTIDQCILPSLIECKRSGSIERYDAEILHGLFRKGAKTWTDCFRPRIVVIQAAILRDATVLKFTVQHAAGDASAIYNAAAAYCEGLHGDVQERPSRADVDYEMIDTETKQDTTVSTSRLDDRFSTSQARAYWDYCDGSLLFPIATILRKRLDFHRTQTRWQTVHFPQHVLDEWRRHAEDAGVKVSTYDIFAAWLHMHLEDFTRANDPNNPAMFAFLIRVKDFFKNPKDGPGEFWNPLSLAIPSHFPQNEGTQQSRLVQGAVNVRKSISEVRDPAYKEDYAKLIKHHAERQGQPLGFGNRLPATMVLTSWSHSPLDTLQMWSDESHEREPLHVQPILNLLKPLPVPDGQDRQFSICWKGKDGGYWLTANLEDDLWRRILDVPATE